MARPQRGFFRQTLGIAALAFLSACQSRDDGNAPLNAGAPNDRGCKRKPFDELLGIACLTHAESDWAIGPARSANPNLPILLLPGHGDYQTRALKAGENWDTPRACAGSNGTNGEARDKNKNPTSAQNLDPSPCPGEGSWELSDEACWNIALVKKVREMASGQLKLQTYDTGKDKKAPYSFDSRIKLPQFEKKRHQGAPTPLPTRCIENADDPHSNWSQAYAHMQKGGYALEIHFDAWNHEGQGSGVIVANPAAKGALVRRQDVELALSFGAYPSMFRDVLGGPKRGLSFLEIGRLGGKLEARLRDPQFRGQTLETLARRIIEALKQGTGRSR